MRKPDRLFEGLTERQIKMLRELAIALPKSVCACGHSGDGGNSFHEDKLFSLGHGRCRHEVCSCSKFTFERWAVGFAEYVRKVKRK